MDDDLVGKVASLKKVHFPEISEQAPLMHIHAVVNVTCIDLLLTHTQIQALRQC